MYETFYRVESSAELYSSFLRSRDSFYDQIIKYNNAIIQVSLSLGKYICGGTIIDSEHILTAAHCIHQPGAKYVPCKAQKSSAGDEIQECSWVSSKSWLVFHLYEIYTV